MRDHYLAVLAHLEGESALAGRVHAAALVDDSGLPARSTYLILFGGAPDDLDDGRLTAIADVASDATFRYTTRSVAPDAAGALAVFDKAHRRLVGARLAIDGRRLQPVRYDGGAEVRADTSVKPPLFYVDADYLLESLRG